MLVEYLRARCWGDIRERAARYRDTSEIAAASARQPPERIDDRERI